MKMYMGNKKPDKESRGNLYLLFVKQDSGEYLCFSTLEKDNHPSVGRTFAEKDILHDLSLGYLRELTCAKPNRSLTES